MKTPLMISLLLSLSLGLAACNGEKSVEQANRDLSEAETDAAKSVVDAQSDAMAKLAETHREAAKDQIDAVSPSNTSEERGEQLAASREKVVEDVADAEKSVAKAEIEASFRVASERCSSYPPKEKSDCLDRARIDYDQRLQAARNQIDASSGAPKL